MGTVHGLRITGYGLRTTDHGLQFDFMEFFWHANVMRIMGLDVGDKRVGVAMSDGLRSDKEDRR
jgi:hypothetical protein